MERLRQLIHEIHRRSLWQVLVPVDLVTSYGVARRARMFLRLCALSVLTLLAVSCGGDDSPTEPETPVATTVDLSSSSLSFTSLGASEQVTATVKDQNAVLMSGATVTWASSDEAIATVSSAGLVTSVGNGSATITATSGAASGSALITVEQVAASLDISSTSVPFASLGDTVRLTAAVTDASGTAIAGAIVTWESSDVAIATVSSTGLVTSVRNGSTSVTASSGGLTATATVNVQQVAASVALSPSDTTIFITALLRVTARDAQGQPITAPEIEWSSQSPKVATVTDGLVSAVSPGLAVITASSGQVSATASVSVVKDLQSPSDLIPSYPYVSAIDQVLVGSDISQAFSDQHVDHMKKVWDYMTGIWAKRRSDRLEWYYSPDRSKTLIAIDLCPTQAVNADTRLLTACYGGAYPIWFIEPYVIPDFGTQLHEISHDFVFPTYWGSAEFPWFAEGTGMYYEGGRFQPDGSLDFTPPVPWLIHFFDLYDSLDQLVGLDALLWLNRDQFYLGENPTTNYAQSGLFWYYLETRHPSVVNELIAQLNGVDPWVRNNQWVLDFILSGTGMTIAQLNEAYLALARSF